MIRDSKYYEIIYSLHVPIQKCTLLKVLILTEIQRLTLRHWSRWYESQRRFAQSRIIIIINPMSVRSFGCLHRTKRCSSWKIDFMQKGHSGSVQSTFVITNHKTKSAKPYRQIMFMWRKKMQKHSIPRCPHWLKFWLIPSYPLLLGYMRDCDASRYSSR